ncbi:SDR family NAD(P)-dependent oxidoreductase [Streptomyces sp. DSM 44917]|uniref:SDR family NAD(P)-dependent oxidoreductase n=1 Tax=Streptomyces boetiae TaxID=3075541 RepID=A0ABU2LCG4_9ACTN|nr:SDR family NAD(P)-dependent oxidoreductase [Streptomyces sp. DSM 44917]MDT0308873.1 SDR family NAD(P)-dependent oxidoreductase [Streptomyces sp. DSM 44917]
MSHSPERTVHDPVAVVGMGCRFPGGAVGVDAFWELLVNGRSGVVEVPADRWRSEDFYDPEPGTPGRTYSRHGGFVDGVREFDAGLFGIAPNEAVGVDPQHRFVLEVAWEALEHAGIAPDSLRGSRTGVYVGISGSDYERLRLSTTDVTAIDGSYTTGVALTMAANRLSFALGLEGPSMAVDTACSSSLVALHLASQALRSGECDTAIVAGVNLILSPSVTVAFSQGRFLSTAGRSATFDAAADGYVRGEGCGVVVLRRAETARESGQRVWALVRGTATNQDGRSNGLTAPRGAAQQAVIRRALEVAGVRPDQVGYVEAHGTGTVLGDPVEVGALAAVLAEGRKESGAGPVALGSVKANIGHLEAGAGIAALIKTVLTVQRGVIPPHPHLTTPNGHIPWDRLPVTVPKAPTPWEAERRFAGVSAFGFGGSNAHVVIESPPPLQAAGTGQAAGADASDTATEEPFLLKVTGHRADAVAAGAERLAAFLRQEAGDAPAALAPLAWAAGVGRADLADRAAVVAATAEEAAERLRAVAEGRPAPGVVRGRRGTGGAPRVGFVVPGQGQRLAGALAGLYGRLPEVTEVVDTVAATVGPVSELPLSALLDDSGDPAVAAALHETSVVQPALFTAAVALGRWWQSAGVRPSAVVGHSAGAYAAAVLAGVFTLEEGARLVATRARLMGELPSDGAMAAVFRPAEDLLGRAALRDGEVVVAARNSARETVVAGPAKAVTALLEELAAEGVRGTRLRVSHAFHSPQMNPVLAPLARAFEGVNARRPTAEFVSDTTGRLAGPEVTTADYWVRHTREPVLFGDAARTLLDRRIGVVIELGAGGLLPLILAASGERQPVCVPSVVMEGGTRRGLLEAAGRVWAAGVGLDWSRVNGPRPAGPLPVLPSYPFQRRTYWLDLPGQAPGATPAQANGAHSNGAAHSNGSAHTNGTAPSNGTAATQAPAADAPAREARRPAVARRGRRDAQAVTALVTLLRDELAAVMDLPEGDELDADAGLFDLGLTSAMVMTMRTRFEEEHGLHVPATAVFEHPTIRRLAQYLVALEGEQATDGKAQADAAPAAPAPALPAADPAEPIAIVGMACRLPGGANDLDSYWRLLREGRDATSPVPPGRWDAEVAAAAARAAGVSPEVFRGGFLDVPVDLFDAEAFGITPREARSMDPQQRLLLEVAWEALEDAGYPATDLAGSPTSVYVGMTTVDYLQLIAADPSTEGDAYSATGTPFSVAAGRLSYLLGTQGPSLAVDTACSSSLVATHLAIRSLRAGESDLSVVAGVNLMLTPSTTTSLANLGALASDGRCKTFDASADGYGRGEGAGVVILKRLRDAVADGDRVWAVLRGSAVNQDGPSAGLTVPNGQAQQRVIREALRDARAEPAAVGYVEAHGTGTSLGDPIEVNALAEVLRPEPGAGAPLRVGSAKTNIGHLEAAAGVAGLIKVALTLHHGEIPPHLHVSTPNPHVSWDRLPVEIPAEPTAWEAKGAPRVAGLSSFGFSGTNAHVVLEEPPRAQEPEPAETAPGDGRASLLVLSARTPEALTALAGRYGDLLAGEDGEDRAGAPAWADVAYNAAVRRTPMVERLALTAGSAAEAAGPLAAAARGEEHAALATGRVVPEDRRRLVFAFSGQGSQWAGMGAGLLTEPAAAAVLHRCDELVRDLAGWSLLDTLRAPAETSLLSDTRYAQPGIVAVQAALTELWREWGVTPDVVVGHSVGEIGAAYAAGSLDLTQAMTVVVRRGEVMAATRGSGAMVAVGLSPEEAAELIAPHGDLLSIAAVNGPRSVVIAGDAGALNALEPAVRGRPAPWARIQEEYAFHTRRMLPARPELLRALEGLEASAPEVALCSTVTGERFEGAPDATYWAENMVRPVRYAEALRTAAAPSGHTVVVEVGPHSVLTTPSTQTLAETGAAHTVLPSQRARRDSRATLLATAGRLHVLGYELDHVALHPEASGRRVTLPAYPWQRRRYWLPKPPAERGGDGGRLEAELADATYEITWQPSAVEPPAPNAATANGGWLIVADGTGEGASGESLAGQVAARLTDAGGQCVVLGPDRLDPRAPETVRQALAEAVAEVGTLRGLVHCGTLAAGEYSGAAGQDLGREVESALAVSCGPLLAASSGLRRVNPVNPPRVWVVTRGAMGIDGGPVATLHSPVWGLARVVALEQPEIWGGLVDLDPETNDPAAEAGAVVAEILAADEEDQVAYRAGARRVARLSRIERLAPAPSAPVTGTDGYLITGGRGALGLRVAEWLVERGARHLVLTGRRPLPEDPADPVTAAVQRLRDAGATVHTPVVDVADPASMGALFEPGAEWPAIRGVVHAAGTFNPSSVAELDWDRFRDMTRAKVDGTLLLDALTGPDSDAAGDGLDFFVMFSSAAAVWGSALAGHYAAANGFLDTMAHHRASRGLPGVAIDWGWWGGSDLVDGEYLHQFEAMGLHVLPDPVGFAALERLLAAHDHRQVTVAPADWDRFRPVLEARRRRPLLAELGTRREAAAAADEEVLRGLRVARGAARVRLMEDLLQREVAAVLGRDEEQRLNRDAGFADAGMDSLMSVELKKRVDRLLGTDLPATAAFEHPTIAALTDYLLTTVLALPQDAADQPAAPGETLDGLSEAELLDLLDQELEQSQSQESTTSPREMS